MLGKTENAKNSVSLTSDEQKNGESGASGHPERLKFRKIMFRDVPTSCFLEK